jgi:hypothetical protein
MTRFRLLAVGLASVFAFAASAPSAHAIVPYVVGVVGAAAAGTAYDEAKEALCTKGPHDCCIEETHKPNPEGREQVRREVCRDGSTFVYADCYCAKDGTSKFQQPGIEFDACVASCKGIGATLDRSQGVGVAGRSSAPGAPKSTIDGLCFTASECATAKGEFEASSGKCPAGNGLCLAPEPEIKLSSPILGQTKVTGIRGFVDVAFRYLISISVVVAGVMFIYAGFTYITSSSGIAIGNAKEMMTNALVGLFLLFGSVMILNAVNPATTRPARLRIYMINRVQFASRDWCKDFKGAGGAAIKYADSGEPAGSVELAQANYSLVVDQTLCGKKYYAEQFGAQMCTGQTCAQKGMTCVACKGGFAECQGNQTGYACVSAAMAGTFTWSGHHYPRKVQLLAVCEGVTPFSVEGIDKAVFEGPEANLSIPKAEERGAGGFVIPAEIATLEQAKQKCGGSFRGFVLGVVYKDSCKIIGEGGGRALSYGAQAGATGAAIGGFLGFASPLPAGTGAGASLGGGIGTVAGTAAGLAVCAVDANDVAVVTKRNCRNPGGPFDGYADGTQTSFDFTDMKTAMFCGWRVNRAAAGSPSILSSRDAGPQGNGMFDANADPAQNPYWSIEELRAAITGDAKAEPCDLVFGDANAPNDPGTKLACNRDFGK